MREILRLTAVSAAVLFLAAAPASAQNVVWWTDGSIGGDGSITGALAARPGLTVYAATDQYDFNAALTSGLFQLAIFGEQNDYIFGSSLGAFGTFTTGGGKVLAASWTRDGSGFASFFGVAVSGWNESTISGSGSMFTGISGNVALNNPGWGVYSEGYIGSGPCLASFEDGSCAAQVALSGNALLLGPLFDTYANAAEGEAYVGNGIDYLLGSSVAAPEPASMTLLATGLLGIFAVTRRRRHQP